MQARLEIQQEVLTSSWINSSSGGRYSRLPRPTSSQAEPPNKALPGAVFYDVPAFSESTQQKMVLHDLFQMKAVQTSSRSTALTIGKTFSVKATSRPKENQTKCAPLYSLVLREDVDRLLLLRCNLCNLSSLVYFHWSYSEPNRRKRKRLLLIIPE